MTARQRERVNGLRREIDFELENWTMLELHYRMSSETKGAAMAVEHFRILQQLPPEFVRAGSFVPNVNWVQIDQCAQGDLHT